jgi:tRNA(Ile)-lysidine synthase
LLDTAVLFRDLAGSRGLILAVSGGPDSTALMLLVARWQERPAALVVTVDHGLRPEAADEARLVAQNAERLGRPWRIMRVEGRPGRGNLQDWARRARYRCLAQAASEASFDTIVTAHHRDDQAETFLLRLARGSGVYGLAGMAGEGKLKGLRLARPLLDVPRATLAEIAAATGLPTADDPSNNDRRYDRVRLRRLMPALAEHGLTAHRLADTAGRLGRAAAALDHYAGALLAAHFRVDLFGVATGPAAALAEVPEEVSLRALARLLQVVGGAEYTPRLDRVEALRAAILAAGDAESLKRTLHGAVVTVERGILTAAREWGRQGIAEIAAPAGAELVWDRRFRVSVPRLPGRLSVGPLGRSNRRLLSNSADHLTLRTLPGLYDERVLLAIPDVVVPGEGGGLMPLAAECIISHRLLGGTASEGARP